MSKLVEDFFDAVNTISQGNVDASKNDSTIDAEIKSVVNVDLGQYKVLYQGNIFDAYAMDPLSVYKAGEQVFVLVPQGDFSKRKVIIGRSELKSGDSFEDRQDMTNFYIQKGPNWITDWYKLGHESPLQICAVPYSGRHNLLHQSSYESITEELEIVKPQLDAAEKDKNEHPGDIEKELVYDSLKYRYDTLIEQQKQALASATVLGANYTDYGFLRVPGQKDGIESCDRIPTSYLDAETLEKADEQIARYSQSFDAISISATFKTTFQNTHTNGKYALVVECIVKNSKYITDVRDPDASRYMGQAWYEAQMNYLKFQQSIDQEKYNTDETYREEVDTESQRLLEIIDNVQPDQKEFNVATFELGFNSFTGAPYSYIMDTPQKAYFAIDKGSLKGLNRIYLKQDGNFVADITPTYNPDGTISWDSQHSVLDRNNIYCDAIDIRFCQKVNLTDTLYYPWIETPYGDSVYGAGTVSSDVKGRGFVTLIAHLQYGLEDILSEENCQVYWFKQDPTVTAEFVERMGWQKDEHNNTLYDYGGDAWYPIDLLITKGENDAVNYDIDFDTLVVRRDAVQFKNKYKAVIVYRDMSTDEQREITRVEVEQEIVRLDSAYDLVIVQETAKNGKDVTLRVVNNKKPDTAINPKTGLPWPQWFGTWWLKSQAGAYYQISEGIQHGPIVINDFLFDPIATFFVEAYDPELIDPNNTGEAINQIESAAVLEKTIVTAEEGDLLFDWVGIDSFNYDALGNIRGDADTKDNTLVPVLKWADGKVSDYHFTVYAPGGEPLGNKEFYNNASTTQANNGYNWVDASGKPMSMLKNMWCDPLNGTIHFQLRPQYVQELADASRNTFTIKVTIFDGRTFEVTKAIRILKDGDMGTTGSDWAAPIRPCNWKYSPEKQEGPYLEELNFPPLLIVNKNEDGEWVQDKNFRVFLRPFATKNGQLIEQMDPFEGYFCKVYWDVRMPGSVMAADVKYASWLRFHHTDGTPSDIDNPGNIYGRDKSWYETGNIDLSGDGKGLGTALDRQQWNSKVNDREQEPNGLIAFTMYPRKQYQSEEVQFATENYGAVEVRFFDNEKKGTGADIERCMYRFIVKAQVDIMKGQYDQKDKMIETDGDIERIASVVSYYPIDVLFNDSEIVWDDSEGENAQWFEPLYKIFTNWPRFVEYDARGLEPKATGDPLYFKFAYNPDEEGVTNYKAYNLTPLTQTLETSLNPETQQEDQYYRAKPHLNLTEGFHGALQIDITHEGPFKKGRYIRNQVMYMNAYGNVDINGWDGEGIDMNEEDGTIFANTIGAGYKTPQTNLFTGVLMGVDRSQKKKDIQGLEMDEESLKYRQYMTGIFGYQDGVSSFGIMENGTAFFGRADRGGRIIVDGTNATIYGGGNGVMDSPSIGDPMWNTMRLTLADLNHTTSPYSKNIDGFYTYNLDGEYFIKDGDKFVKVERDKQDGPLFMGVKNEVPSLRAIDALISIPKFKDRVEKISTSWIIGSTTLTQTQYDDLLAIAQEDCQTTVDTIKTYFKQENGMYLLVGDPEKTDIGFMTQGFDGAYFQLDAGNKAIDKQSLPRWYGHLWQKAYVKPDGALPYWFKALAGGESPDWSKLPSYLDKAVLENLDPELGLGFTGEDGQNYRINYFGPVKTPSSTDATNIVYADEDGNEFDTLENYVNAHQEVFGPLYRAKADTDNMVGQDSSVLKSQQLSGFGPSRASTTPAIEIGQHVHGLMPGLLDWDLYEDVFKTLSIPGDRNFLVTYDGTLWAMNGVFMGAVIGSNIIGGRIQGAEIGIGSSMEADTQIWTMDPKVNPKLDCSYPDLEPPMDVKASLIDIIPYTGEKPRAFYVSYDGSVYAQKLYIYGGSIDIGRFHILGLDRSVTEEGAGIDDPNYGHLVQAAESDFIGVTHFYGNVGIGPCLGDNTFDTQQFGSSKGNFFQTHGYVALGIPLPRGNQTDIHARFIRNMRLSTSRTNSVSSDGFYRAGKNDYEAGNPRIGLTQYLEQSAMFGLDSASRDIPQDASDEGYFQGHFWPMHFHFGGRMDTRGGVDSSQLSSLSNGYFTTMDIFENKGDKLTTGTGDKDMNSEIFGSNYFRVGPYGTEAMQIFIRRNFQSQDSSEIPSGVNGIVTQAGLDKEVAKDNYLGWIGLTNRSGYSPNGKEGKITQLTVGITTWYTAPIIFSSDGESAWLTRGHIHFLTQAYGVGASKAITWNKKDMGEYQHWGVYFNMGRSYSWGDSNRNGTNESLSEDANANNFTVKTSHGKILLSVESYAPNQGGSDNPWRDAHFQATGNPVGAGLQIDPQGSTAMERAGVWLWASNITNGTTMHGKATKQDDNEIHIVHRGDRMEGDCSKVSGMTEILMDKEAIYMYAPKRIVMKFGQADYSAHRLKAAAAGQGGETGQPPTIIEGDDDKVDITHGKELHIFIEKDNTNNNSEIAMYKNKMIINSSTLMLGGAGGEPHAPGNYMLLNGSKVDFTGIYAEPDNQYHIYARFG